MPLDRRTLDVDGRRVTCVDTGPASGTGPGVPLVCLHGAGFDHAELTWRLTAASLRARRRVIVPDLPGYGGSEALPGAQDLAALGAWVLAFLDAAGLERVDLAGVSMGGGMALWVAIRAPARVRRLVPVCAYGLMPRANHHRLAWLAWQAGAMGLAYRAAAISPRLARLGLALSYGDPDRVSAKAVQELRRTARDQARRRSFDAFLAAEMNWQGLKSDLTPDLGRITAPTLLIAGRQDRLVPAQHLRRARERIADCRYLGLPTGHWPMRERPDLFNPALAGFLARADAAETAHGRA